MGLILLITFPSQLFNRTYEENHERIRGWWERRLGWTARLRRRSRGLTVSMRGALSFVIVVLAGGVLAAMLDPGFGINVRSLALFVGAVLALVAGLPSARSRAARTGVLATTSGTGDSGRCRARCSSRWSAS